MSPRGVPATAVVAIVLSLLVLLSCGGVGECAPAPLFGAALLGSLFGGGDVGNGTSALSLLALSHLQHKLDTLQQFAELLNLGTNVTESFIVN